MAQTNQNKTKQQHKKKHKQKKPHTPQPIQTPKEHQKAPSHKKLETKTPKCCIEESHFIIMSPKPFH